MVTTEELKAAVQAGKAGTGTVTSVSQELYNIDVAAGRVKPSIETRDVYRKMVKREWYGKPSVSESQAPFYVSPQEKAKIEYLKSPSAQWESKEAFKGAVEQVQSKAPPGTIFRGQIVTAPQPGEWGYHATSSRPGGIVQPIERAAPEQFYDRLQGLPARKYDPKYGLMIRSDLARQPSIFDVPEFRAALGQKSTSRIQDMYTYPVYERASFIKESLYNVASTIEGKGKKPGSLLRTASPYAIRSLGNVIEFGGMIPAGTERIIKEPKILPAAIGAGVLMQVGGIAEQAKTSPAQLASDIALFGVVSHGVGKGAGIASRELSSQFTAPKVRAFIKSETAIKYVDPWAKQPTMRQTIEKRGGTFEPRVTIPTFRDVAGGTELATSGKSVLVQKQPVIVKTYSTTHATLYPETQVIKPIVAVKPVKVLEQPFLTKPLSYAEQMKIRAANIKYATATPQIQKMRLMPMLLPVQIARQISPQVQKQRFEIPQIQRFVTPQIQKPVSVQVPVKIQIPKQIQRTKLVIPQIPKIPTMEKQIERTKPPTERPPTRFPSRAPETFFKPPIKPKPQIKTSAVRRLEKMSKAKLGKFGELSRVASKMQVMKGLSWTASKPKRKSKRRRK